MTYRICESTNSQNTRLSITLLENQVKKNEELNKNFIYSMKM